MAVLSFSLCLQELPNLLAPSWESGREQLSDSSGFGSLSFLHVMWAVEPGVDASSRSSICLFFYS